MVTMTSLLTPYKCSQISSVSSTPSTPGADSFFWDTPETPSRQSIRGDLNLSTPLTPPLSPDEFGQTCEPRSRVKPESLSVADEKSPTQNLSPDLDPLCENGRSAQVDLVADAATPGELFRNCKDLLLEIAKKSSSKPQIQYNLAPSIDFCPTKQSSPANATLIKEESDHASLPVPKKNLEIHSVTAGDPHSKDPYTGLQAILEHVMPSELHNRLKDYPKLCVASCVKKPSVRCTNGTRSESIDKHTALKAVSRCIREGYIATLPEELKKLAKILCCGSHQNVALKQPKAGARIDTLRDFIINLPSASEKDALTFRAWTMALANLSHPIPPHCSAPKPSSTEVPLNTNTTIASNNKTTPPLPGFIPYKSTPVSNVDIVRDLKELIARPLSPKDLESGFIYIFWNQGSFGMIKIGRTNNLERRLKEWRRCKSTHSYHKASQEGELLEVPHVQRIEKLMHAELVNTRRKQPCNTCKKTNVHQEWFQTSEAKAVKVFQKWQDWILMEPYMENDEGKWVIRPEMLETIPELCTLEPEKVSPAKTQPRSAKNGSERPKPRRSIAMQALDASDSAQTSRNGARG